jgi:hypothetical protein
MNQYVRRLLNPLSQRYCYYFNKKGDKRPIIIALECWWQFEVLPWFSKKHVWNGDRKTYINGKPTLYYYRWQILNGIWSSSYR